jgi:hypothetical protein
VPAQLVVISEYWSFGQVFVVGPFGHNIDILAGRVGGLRLEVGQPEMLLHRWSWDGPFEERCWPC